MVLNRFFEKNYIFIFAIFLISVTLNTFFLFNKSNTMSIKNGEFSINVNGNEFYYPDAILVDILEIEQLTYKIACIVEIETYSEQNKYIERAIQTYYDKAYQILIKHNLNNAEIKKYYQTLFSLHMKIMEEEFLSIIEKNHLSEQRDWAEYKNRISSLLWNKAVREMDKIFSVGVDHEFISNNRRLLDSVLVDFEILFRDSLNIWLDDIKGISISQIKKRDSIVKEVSKIKLKYKRGK